MTSKVMRFNNYKNELNTHFKNGNFILSIHDSIGIPLRERFKNIPDSVFFKNDTIDLSSLDQFYSAQQIKRELRKCIERKETNIYSLAKSKYLKKIKRTISKTNFNGIHSYYIYSNPIDNAEILNSHSFITGTPSF